MHHGFDLVFVLHRKTWAVSDRDNRSQDRLLRSLSRSDGPGRLLVADHYSSVMSLAVRRLRGVRRPTAESARAVASVAPKRLVRNDPTSISEIAQTYRRHGDLVRRAAGKADLKNPVIVTTNPFTAAYADLSWAARVTYFATDNFAAVRSGDMLLPYLDAYRDAYERIGTRRVNVAAVTGRIIDEIAPTGDTLVVPNAVDESEWSVLPPPPKWLDERFPRPRLVYIGGLNHRLDLDAITAAARGHPNGSVLLLGPVIDPDYLGTLRTISNVHMLPPVAHTEVVAVLGMCDVGILPHLVNEVTIPMSPLKAYEYFAAGLPIVSTALPEMRRFGARVLIAEPGDFGESCSAALRFGRASEASRRTFVKANSWPERHQSLLDFAGGLHVV